MYKTLIWCASASAGVATITVIMAVAFASPRQPTMMNALPAAPAVIDVTPTEMPVQPAAANAPSAQDAQVDRLAGYVLDAMNSWMKQDKGAASFPDIAHDIASVVLDPAEPPIWTNDSNKSRTALMLASLAFWETQYRAYTDDGRCNDKQWRRSQEGLKLMSVSGYCDGGIARSMWQIHADLGGVLVIPANYDDDTRELSKREWCYATQCSDDGTVVKPDEFTNRVLAARVALHMARRSIRHGAGLCQYTGEIEACPKGEVRYNWAVSYAKKHPFVPLS